MSEMDYTPLASRRRLEAMQTSALTMGEMLVELRDAARDVLDLVPTVRQGAVSVKVRRLEAAVMKIDDIQRLGESLGGQDSVDRVGGV